MATVATVVTATPDNRRTQLQRPRTGADLVARPRLEARLARVLGYPLAVVSGPPGSGKTTLVARWLEGAGVASVWLALDERDATVAGFAAELLAALQPYLTDAVTEPLAYLRHAGELDARTLGDLLGDALLDLPAELVVVLDDAHVLADGPVMALLSGLLTYPPPRLHLVLVTRQEPALPLARLRARGQLVELRAEDLAFTDEEARAFLRLAYDGELAEDDARQLAARTEGWAAGLRLASLALRRRPVAEVAGDLGRRRELDELLGEVLDRLPPERHDFVLAATLPERVCPSLAAALLDEFDEAASAALLEEALRANAFITLVSADGWYRFHQLFREVLARRRLRLGGAAREAALHRRASDWFERHGEIEDALRHALAAGDTTLAAEIVERSVHPALDDDDWSAVQRWLAILPAAVVDARPGLLLARAWVAIFRATIAEIPRLIEQAAARVDAPADPARAGELAGLRAIVAASRGEVEHARQEAESALALMPESWRAARGVIVMRVAAALRANGAVDASRAYATVLLDPVGRAQDGFTLRVRTALGVEHILSGNPGQAVAILPATVLESEASGRLIVATMARSFLGLAHSLRGELDEAIACFERVLDRRYDANLFFVIDSALGLVLARALRGDGPAASGALDAFEAFLYDIGVSVYAAEFASLRARIALLGGERELALRWLERAEGGAGAARILAVERPALTAARVRLARGLPDDLAQARATLDGWLARAEHARDVPLTLEVGVLLALVHAREGAVTEARALLERLAPHAARSGIVRPFLEAGAPAVALLRAQRAGSAAPAAIDRLLAACGARETRPAEPRPPAPASAPERAVAAGLTDRELDVLQGLVDRLTNKEIAERLFISPETVKYHAASIYLKLAVGSRREAALRGIDLGLTPVPRGR